MIRTSLVCLACLVPFLGGAPLKAPVPPPKGEPPSFFQVTHLDEESVELKGPGAVLHKVALSDLEIAEAGGTKLSVKDFRNRVKAGSVVLVASDEQKIDPAFLRTVKDETVVLVGVTVQVARADKPGRGWTKDLKLMKPADRPVSGRILGAEFKPDSIQLVNTGLSIRSGKDSMHIFLRLRPGEGIEDKTYEFSADGGVDARRPAIHCHIHSLTPLRVKSYVKDYAMRLEFGKKKDGNIPAKMYLCLPDENKSWLAGTFSLRLSDD